MLGNLQLNNIGAKYIKVLFDSKKHIIIAKNIDAMSTKVYNIIV